MPSAMVDTRYPHSDEAMRLRRMLDDDTADALPMRLWCWGIDTDRESGRFEADANQLAKIVHFSGNPDQLLHAFLECEVITPTGKTNEYRINGWKINERFFSERNRLRKLRRTQDARVQDASNTRAKRKLHANKTEPPSSSSYSPTSPSEKWGEGPREGPPPASQVRTMAEARALLVTTEQAVELFEHWQTEQHRTHGTAKVLVAPSAGLENAKRVIANASGDMQLAKSAVTALVETTSGYWHERQHALYLLADPRDFERARIAASTPRKEFSDADIGF